MALRQAPPRFWLADSVVPFVLNGLAGELTDVALWVAR
jgi:hypothetical protein